MKEKRANNSVEVLKKSLQEINRKIELLHEIAQRLWQCETEDEVYKLTVDTAEEIISFSMCTLSIMEDNNLVVKDALFELPSDTDKEAKFDDDLARKTYYTGKTYIFSSLDEIPREYTARENFESIISAPIGEIGVFQAFSTEPGAFTEDDARLIELLLSHTVETVRRIHLQEEVRRQAIHDPLTGVYNRYYFNEILQKEKKRSKRYERPIAFLMIDINDLGTINDQFGFHIGDEVLQTVASLLLEVIRETDIVVRYSGDEFLIVLPETNSEEAEFARQRIIEKGSRLYAKHKLLDFPVTLSIGIAYWGPNSSESVEEVLSKAYKRMYEDKQRDKKN